MRSLLLSSAAAAAGPRMHGLALKQGLLSGRCLIQWKPLVHFRPGCCSAPLRQGSGQTSQLQHTGRGGAIKGCSVDSLTRLLSNTTARASCPAGG